MRVTAPKLPPNVLRQPPPVHVYEDQYDEGEEHGRNVGDDETPASIGDVHL